MTREEIFAGESKNLEFKESRPEQSIKYMKSVIAFANGKGGRLVFGVNDKREKESEGRSYDTVVRRDLTVSDEDIDKLCSDMKEVASANCKNETQRQALKDVTKNVLKSV